MILPAWLLAIRVTEGNYSSDQAKPFIECTSWPYGIARASEQLRLQPVFNNKMAQEFVLFRLAAILCRKYRVPSEPRSQAASGAVSTGVGDHFGTPRAAGFFTFANFA